MNYVSAASIRVKIIIHALVLGLSIWGISEKDFTGEKLSAFEKILIETFAPVQNVVKGSKNQISDFFKHYLFLVNASRENEIYKNKIANLEQKIFSLNEVARENNRLKSLLKFGDEINKKKILAQVIGKDIHSEFHTIRINKGKKDGIKVYSTVVTADGLVGYIYRTTNNYSDILTILDRNNRVDAIVSRTRSHGILEGYSGASCIMKYVTRTEPVVLQDTVVTAGLGNIYPKSIKVGVVSNIERESYGITQFIEVKPSVDFSKLEEVIVLVNSGDKTREKEFTTLDKLKEIKEKQ